MIFLWIIIGCVALAGAFFLPPPSIEIWPALNASGIAAILYLASLLLFMLRKPIPAREAIVIGIVAVGSMTAIGFFWTGMQTTTLWQQSQLVNIATIVNRGAIEQESSQKLLAVLDRYHNGGAKKVSSIKESFLQLYPGSVIGSNLHEHLFEGDSLRLFVTALEDSCVTITASHAFAKGRDRSFIPYWGRTGTIQERYILTAKGVRHESDN